LSPRNISYPASEIAREAASYPRNSLMDGFTTALTQTGGGADFRSPAELNDPCGHVSPFSVMSVIADGVDEVRKAARERRRREHHGGVVAARRAKRECRTHSVGHGRAGPGRAGGRRRRRGQPRRRADPPRDRMLRAAGTPHHGNGDARGHGAPTLPAGDGPRRLAAPSGRRRERGYAAEPRPRSPSVRRSRSRAGRTRTHGSCAP
jgi:hypothetical protein